MPAAPLTNKTWTSACRGGPLSRRGWKHSTFSLQYFTSACQAGPLGRRGWRHNAPSVQYRTELQFVRGRGWSRWPPESENHWCLQRLWRTIPELQLLGLDHLVKEDGSTARLAYNTGTTACWAGPIGRRGWSYWPPKSRKRWCLRRLLRTVPELQLVGLDLKVEDDGATGNQNPGSADACSASSVQHLNCSLSG